MAKTAEFPRPRRKRISVLATLLPRQVREIRTLHGKGWSQNRLARRYGVSQVSIHNVLVGKTYKTVI